MPLPSRIDPEELVGLNEVASLGGVSRQAAANWRSRDKSFPKPVVIVSGNPVFLRGQIRKYLLKRRKRPMAHVISFINLKGGVGKTTTTVAAAELLAGEFGKRVLVIDLDPQTNATVMLIDEEPWGKLNESGHTLATLFADALEEDPERRRFNLEKTIQRNVSPVRDLRNVDLLPSSIDLINVQDRLAGMPMGRFYSGNPTDLLRRATKPVLDEYDFVLIDCPPNLGIITLNGLRISSGFFIPTIPDVLSTYGIPQILNRVSQFADEIAETIEPYGILISKYRQQSTVHLSTTKRLREDPKMPRVLDTVIPETNAIAAAAEFAPTGTLRQRWGYQGQFDSYYLLIREILGVLQ